MSSAVHQILPEAAYEVSAMLLVRSDDGSRYIGNINDPFQSYLEHLPAVITQLGTKVSHRYPSCMGFRVMLRTHIQQAKSIGSLEDNYHVFSFKYCPNQTSGVVLSQATDEDKKGILKTLHHNTTPKDPFRLHKSQTLYKLDFNNSDNVLFVSRHGPELQTSNTHAQKIERMMPLIPLTREMSLFFPADDILVAHLKETVKNDCIGVEAQSWKISLPESAVPIWQYNVQTRMVAGSIDLLNVLNRALHDGVLQDGSNTPLNRRPQAILFRGFLRAAYPSLILEPMNKVYPVFLDVVNGLCVELPFGASMINRENTYAGINALHLLLRAGIPGGDIGIVSLYPAQVQAYREALQQCHVHAPKIGYNAVTADVLEAWVNKEIGITIVDLVRTANASGNLGYLSQARRLKLLLSTHRNGMIVVGDLKCTVTSLGTVTSTKLHKVLQWFSNNGRVVSVLKDGLPQNHPPASPKPQDDQHGVSPLSPTLRHPLLASSPPTYVGLPGLEHLSISKTTHEGGNVSKPVAKKQIISDSFARQGFLAQKQVAPQTSASKRETSMFDRKSPRTDPLHDRGTSINAHKSGVETNPPHRRKSTNPEPRMISPAKGLQPTLSLVPVNGEMIKRDALMNSGDQCDRDFRSEPSKHAQNPVKAKSVEQSMTQPTPNSLFDSLASQLKTQAHQQVFNESLDPKTQTSNHGLDLLTDTYTHQNKSQARGNCAPSGSGLHPDQQSHIHIDLGKSTSKATKHPISLRPGDKKTKQQDWMTGQSAQDLISEHLNIGDLMPPLRPMVKPNTSSTVPEQQPSSINIPLQVLDSTLAKKSPIAESQPPANDFFAPNPVSVPPVPSNSVSLRNPNIPQPPEQAQTPQMKPDFKDRYRAKYIAVRSMFDSLHDNAVASPAEDHLFRRLAEAYINEDARDFETVYMELIGIAKSSQLGNDEAEESEL